MVELAGIVVCGFHTGTYQVKKDLHTFTITVDCATSDLVSIAKFTEAVKEAVFKLAEEDY